MLADEYHVFKDQIKTIVPLFAWTSTYIHTCIITTFSYTIQYQMLSLVIVYLNKV